jgi:hypothetical protein
MNLETKELKLNIVQLQKNTELIYRNKKNYPPTKNVGLTALLCIVKSSRETKDKNNKNPTNGFC